MEESVNNDYYKRLGGIETMMRLIRNFTMRRVLKFEKAAISSFSHSCCHNFNVLTIIVEFFVYEEKLLLNTGKHHRRRFSEINIIMKKKKTKNLLL